MKWLKIGRVFLGPARYPTVDKVENKIRIYYSKLVNKKSKIFSFDVDGKNPSKIIGQNKKAIMQTGKAGSFDQDGHAARCIVEVKNKKLMYLIGWNKKISPPYHLSIGVAEFKDGAWIKYEGPVMDRGCYDPYFCTSPCVIYDEDKYKMWYCSCTEWINDEPVYLIKYAESKDGLNWDRSSHVCINYDKSAKAIGWPVVWKEDNLYKMTYCYRGLGDYRKNPKKSYRIGFATSNCGLFWKKQNKKIEGLEVSRSGWDSEMICYPSFIDNYVFYNGNNFGDTGIGVAVKL